MADLTRALELLADPALDPAGLRRIAELHPELHTQVAAHPAAWSGLLEWLSMSPDPAVRAAVAQRWRELAQPAAVSASAAPSVVAPVAPSVPAGPPVGAPDGPPVAAPAGSPVTVPARAGRGRLVALIVGVLVVLLAAGGAVWALVLRPSSPSDEATTPGSTASVAGVSPGPGVPGKVGDFRNGAEKLWSVSASDLLSKEAVFAFWHDNARTELAMGPVASAGVWLVKVRPTDDTELKVDHLVAIDVATGKSRWAKQWGFETDCVAVPGRPQYLCVYPKVGATTGKALLVDAADGKEKMLADISARDAYAVSSPHGLIVIEGETSNKRVLGFDLDGSARFEKTVENLDALLDTSRPVDIIGDQFIAVSYSGTVILDVVSGQELGSFNGEPTITGYGHYIPKGNNPPAPIGVSVLKESGRDKPGRPYVLARSIVWVDAAGVTLCDIKNPDKCRSVSGLEKVWSQPQWAWEVVFNGKSYLLLKDIQPGVTGVVDVATARYLGAQNERLGWVPSDGQVTIDGPVDSPSVKFGTLPEGGGMEIRHPVTGALLGRAPSSEELRGMVVEPGYLAVGSGLTRTTGTLGQLTAYRAAEKPTALIAPDGSTETVEVPSGIPECPSGTIRLAWAEITNGWIIVCGHYAGEPTVIRYNIGGSTGESSKVTYDGVGIYRGSLSQGGSVWLAHSPGVAGFTAADGTISQQTQVVIVWFVALGTAQPKAGPFGVPLPKHSAEDQVRYLSELLAKSKVARKSLASSVETLAVCSKGSSGDYSSEITAIDEVTINREQMLRALAAAPVDLVPEGRALLGELTVAIGHSYDADVAFASWGRSIQRDGCRKTGSPAGEVASVKATKAKTVFADHWNRVIASAYPVAKLTEGDL